MTISYLICQADCASKLFFQRYSGCLSGFSSDHFSCFLQSIPPLIVFYRKLEKQNCCSSKNFFTAAFDSLDLTPYLAATLKLSLFCLTPNLFLYSQSNRKSLSACAFSLFLTCICHSFLQSLAWKRFGSNPERFGRGILLLKYLNGKVVTVVVFVFGSPKIFRIENKLKTLKFFVANRCSCIWLASVQYANTVGVYVSAVNANSMLSVVLLVQKMQQISAAFQPRTLQKLQKNHVFQQIGRNQGHQNPWMVSVPR